MTSPVSGDQRLGAVESPDGPVDVGQRSAALRVAVQVVRVVLVGCLLGQIAAVLWLTSVDSDLRTLVADLRAGRVAVLEIGETPVTDWLHLSAGGDPDPMVRWRTDDGAWRVLRLDNAEFPTRDLLPQGPDPYGAPVPRDGERVAGMLSGESQAVVRAIAAAYAPQSRTLPVRSTEDNPWQWSVDAGGSVAALVMLLTLLAGPQPRLATKWAWFWLYFIPAWLGLLAALVLEKPWSDRPGTRERRLDGLQAFAIVLVVGLFVWPLLSILVPG